MKTVIDKNSGKVLFVTVVDVEIAIDQLLINDYPKEDFAYPYYNFTTNLFYEGIPSVDIIPVPQEVQLWRIRTVLKLMDLEVTIETALNSLDEPTKTGALYIWEYGTTIERPSQTVLLLQNILQMTDEQVNEIFIQANNIQL